MRKRLGAIVALAIGLLVLFAAPALAHITVDPTQAPKGSFTKLVFRVPNEMDVANTVKFNVKFDGDHPIATVRVKPKAGWTPTVSMTSLRAPLQTDHGQVTKIVSEIVWSGGTIAPGQFDEFEVTVGPLPSDVDLLLFDAVQTYSDSTEVSWTQQSFVGQPAPDHPAPLLKLTAAGGPPPAPKSSSGPDFLAIVAAAIGSAGLGVGCWVWWTLRHWR